MRSVAIISLSLLTLVLGLGPRLLALYHQEQGARLLARALLVEGRAEREDLWLDPQPLIRPEARSLAAEALAHFEAAVATDSSNFQTHRWQGRAALLLDRPEEAIAAFSAAVRLRPTNPMAWWELGLAYERLGQGLEEAVHLTLASDSGHTVGPVPIAVEDMATLILREAAVETPRVPIDTPYCALGEAPESCFVARTEWEMPDAPKGEPRGWWVPEEPMRRAVLFMHPPARATLTVTLPVTPTMLTFWMGIEPTAWPWLGDGMVYRVWVDGEKVFEHALTPEAAREGWWPGVVDLSGWAGRVVRLMLETDNGPAGDGQGDWAGWGDLRLVLANSARCWLASCRDRAAAAWRKGGFTAQDLIQAGETARRAKRYEEALWWYERAARVEPGLADPWYYAGLAYEGMERWGEALAAYEQAIGLSSFARVHRSSLYYRIGVIYQWRLEPRRVDAALAAYEMAIAMNDFSANWEAADSHYKRGEILWWMGRDPNEYIAEFQKAIKINPRHEWAHIRLGLAYYARDKDAAAAEAEIRQAIVISPKNKWAYYHLGEIYRQEGRVAEARVMYEKALEIDPRFEAARKQLENLGDGD